MRNVARAFSGFPDPIRMKVTVCQLHDSGAALDADWTRLVAHVKSVKSELVVLPEMPFFPWLPRSPIADATHWNASIQAHDHWQSRLRELAPAIVVGTRPVGHGNPRYNQGYLWSSRTGVRPIHAKTQVEDKPGMWEAAWYQPAYPAEPRVARVGEINIGLLIGAELNNPLRVQQYRDADLQLLITPRSTRVGDFMRWLSAARIAAVLTGAYQLSSNRVSQDANDSPGWVVSPSGEILAYTSPRHPFVSLSVDMYAYEVSQSLASTA